MLLRCSSCASEFSYEIPYCTFCRGPLELLQASEGVVLAVTEVSSPSLGHEDTPYWVALARGTEQQVCEMIKLDRSARIGDCIPMRSEVAAPTEVVGIVGSGTIGKSLVEFFLWRGHRVAWIGRSGDRMERAERRVFGRLRRVLDDAQMDDAGRRLSAGVDYGLLRGCNVVIEAVVEDVLVKQQVLAKIEATVDDTVLIATNTSGIPLDDLAPVLTRPARFGGLHFFNPATRMRLVETSVSSATDETTAAFLDEFATSIGKVPVRVASKPAFVVNRVLMPLLNEAVRTLEEEVAPAASIDEAVRLGLNHPMGPLALTDLIGLDVVVDILDDLATKTGDPVYEPRPTLRRLVAEGKLGRKAGEGFYKYAG